MYLKKKFVKIIVAVFSVLVVAILLSRIGNNPVQRTLYGVFSPLYKVTERVVTPTRGFLSHMKNANEYEKEIEELKKQVNALKVENRSREELISENKRFKELLELKDEMSSCETVTARVVSYEPNSWYDTIMLNKGEHSGIAVGNVVITGLGIVGKVTDVGKNWAKVSTILNISNSEGARVARTGDIGVVSGDAELAGKKLLKLEYLSNDKKLMIGDILQTSGLGGVYPSGLNIGKISEIKSDDSGNMDYAVVEPSADFSSLYEVLVITYYEEGTQAMSYIEEPTEETAADNQEGAEENLQ